MIGFLYELVLIFETDVLRSTLGRGRFYANHSSSISRTVRAADDMILTICSSCRRLSEIEQIFA